MAHRVGVLRQQLAGHAVRLVFALPFFVLHHPTLQIQFLLVKYAEQMAHAVALRKQHIIEH